MAKITFGGQKAGRADRTEQERADRVRTERSNVPDFLRDVPEADNVGQFLIGGWIRIYGAWVYITRLDSENTIVATVRMKLSIFESWLSTALCEGVDGWSATPTWGTQEIPRSATASWAAPRFGVVIHPEGSTPPHKKGAFVSTWVAIAILNGGVYPSAEDWGWEGDVEKWYPNSWDDAPLTYRGQSVAVAVAELAEKKAKEKKAKRRQLFVTVEASNNNDDNPNEDPF